MDSQRSPTIIDTPPTQLGSPDSKRILYVSNLGDRKPTDVYVMNADGTGVTRLTTDNAAEGLPTWSPDGTKIAFVSNRDGNEEIYVMNADGTEQTRLTRNPASDEFPDWSPDSTKIAFASGRDGNGEIYVMSADGTVPPDGSHEAKLTTSSPIGRRGAPRGAWLQRPRIGAWATGMLVG